jgi:hypothetical protein
LNRKAAKSAKKSHFEPQSRRDHEGFHKETGNILVAQSIAPAQSDCSAIDL